MLIRDTHVTFLTVPCDGGDDQGRRARAVAHPVLGASPPRPGAGVFLSAVPAASADRPVRDPRAQVVPSQLDPDVHPAAGAGDALRRARLRHRVHSVGGAALPALGAPGQARRLRARVVGRSVAGRSIICRFDRWFLTGSSLVVVWSVVWRALWSSVDRFVVGSSAFRSVLCRRSIDLVSSG